MGELNVAIVGAGIAGLTLAASLHRAGIACTVYEQAPRLVEAGAGIQLTPNATRLLHRLGLQPLLRQVAVIPQAIEMHRWDDGRLLHRTPLGGECAERFGAPYYTVHRADLQQALLALVPARLLRLNRRCVWVRHDGSSWRLRFADRHEAYADVLVGADGIHSVVRRSVMNDQPRYSGQTIFRGLVDAHRVPLLTAEPRVLLWFGPDQHCVCYPVSAGRRVSFGATVSAPHWGEESWTARASTGELAAAYRGWNGHVTSLLAAAETVSRWALYDRDNVDRWGTGHLTLVGDAAHPMLPFQAQGANQAIEDSVVLAACLARGDEAVAAALRRYERLRRPRTDQIQHRSRDNSRIFHLADGEAQRERDSSVAAASGLAEHAWLFGYDAETVAA